MTISLAEDTRNAVVDAIAALLPSPDSRMVIYDSEANPLVEIPFDSAVFDPAAGGEAELDGVPLPGTAGDAGTAVSFIVFDDATEILSGGVGIAGSGQPAIISSTTIANGDTIQLNSFTLIAPE